MGFLLCFACGCAATGQGSTPSLADREAAFTHLEGGNLADAGQKLPPGTRLGAPYISALGESCYEVASEQTPAPPGQALCLRQQGWELLPPIHMDIPATGARAARPS